MRKVIIKFINIYQMTLSPDKGYIPRVFGGNKQVCKFYPTCSDYSKTAILEYGTLKGGWMSVKRIARCNPFQSPEVDEVPKKPFK